MSVLLKDFCDIDIVHALVWRITTISPPPSIFSILIQDKTQCFQVNL